MQTGSYMYHLGLDQVEEPEMEHSISAKGQLFLEYEPVTVASKTATATNSEGSEPQCNVVKPAAVQDKPRKEFKNNEQIDDFLRKLGFMDKEREGGDFIKQFLHLSQVIETVYIFVVYFLTLFQILYMIP